MAIASERVGDVVIDRGPGVLRATLDRAECRNAINEGIISGLEAALATAAQDEARVMVIRGAGGTFCSGADLRHMLHLRETTERGTEAFIERLAALLVQLERSPFVTLAAVEGHAVAGGCEILLACDVVLVRSDATVGDRHLEYGLLPGAGGSVRMPRTLSKARARYLLLTGDLIDGATAADWGLATKALSPADFERGVEVVVERLRTRSGGAIAAMKQMLTDEDGLDISDAIRVEREIVSAYRSTSPDSRKGLEAFVEKRPPSVAPPP